MDAKLMIIMIVRWWQNKWWEMIMRDDECGDGDCEIMIRWMIIKWWMWSCCCWW